MDKKYSAIITFLSDSGEVRVLNTADVESNWLGKTAVIFVTNPPEGKEKIQLASPYWNPELKVERADFAVYLRAYPYKCSSPPVGVLVSGHPLSPVEPFLLMNMQLDPAQEGYDTRSIKYDGRSYCVPDHGIVAFTTGRSLASTSDPLDEIFRMTLHVQACEDRGSFRMRWEQASAFVARWWARCRGVVVSCAQSCWNLVVGATPPSVSGEKTIADLPNEILAEIMDFIPFGARHNVLPLVSQRFNDVLQYLARGEGIYVRDGAEVGGLTTRDLLQTFSDERRRAVKWITLCSEGAGGVWSFSNVAKVILSMEWTNLRHLTLDGTFLHSSDAAFVQAARDGRLANLRHLVLHTGTPLGCWDLLDWDMKFLQSLDVEVHAEYLFGADPEDDYHPFDRMLFLSRVKFYWDGCSMQWSETPLFSRFLSLVITPSVSELTVDTHDYSDLSLDSLPVFPGITVFGASYSWIATKLSDELARGLVRAFPNIVEFRVDFVFGFPEDAMPRDFFQAIERELGEGWSFDVTRTLVEEDQTVKVLECKFVR